MSFLQMSLSFQNGNRIKKKQPNQHHQKSIHQRANNMKKILEYWIIQSKQNQIKQRLHALRGSRYYLGGCIC